jgi:hippurate hydrolase
MAEYGVRRVYGFHLWPTLEKNAVGTRPGEFMAAANETDITVLGKNAHCGSAEEGVDALYIGCELVHDFCRMEREELPESEYRLLKFGKMKSGLARNIISASTEIEASLRCFNEETGEFLLRRMREIAAHYEAEYHCKIHIQNSRGHDAVVNDPQVFQEVKQLLSPDYPFHTYEKPLMQAEDFSYFLREAPGLFLFLGTGTELPLHTGKYDLDEDVLKTGVEIYRKLLTLPV